MMRRRIFIRKLLCDLFVFAILHSVLSVGIYLVYRDMRLAVAALALGIPFFCMALVRRKLNNIFLFIGAHVLLAAWILWVPIRGLAALFSFAFLASGAIYSMTVRLKGGSWNMEGGVLCFGLGVNTLLALLLEYNGIRELSGLLAFWSFVMVALWLLYTQTLRVDDSTGLLYGQPPHPVGSIIRFNNVMIALFLLLVSGAAALSGFLPLDGLFSLLKSFVMAIVRWLSGLLSGLPGEGEAPLQTPQEQEVVSELFGDPYKPPPAWLQALERIFFFAVQAAVVLGLAAAVLYGAYRLYRRFYASKEADGDTREYIGPAFRRDDLKSILRGIRSRLPAFGGSEREKIRRSYYKKVRRHINRGVKIRREDTTGEISEKISKSEDFGGVTEVYNRARYDRE